ncbi:MAG: hypothetical protein RL730_309 [Actinomycetota bacterium]
MRTKRKIVLVLLIATIFSGVQTTQAKPKAKADSLASYTLIHAIPMGFGADIVDVYLNNNLVIDNATPGAMADLTVPRGNATLKIYANGVKPSDTSTALLSASPVYLSNGSNYSFVAHLSADEKAKLSIFKNMTTDAGSKRSWLTVRHVASAGAVQLRVNGVPTFVPLVNSMERKKSFGFGTYSIDALVSESSTVIAGPTNVAIAKNKNVVLYIWGSKSKGPISILKQEIGTRKDD